MNPKAQSQVFGLLFFILTSCQQGQVRPNSKPGVQFMNHLANENSPYLQQHVHNPVDWYPWGDEAFEKAKELNRPIFLSIGYSTCHWCHVMEKESFEDSAVAAFLNANYVCIKVDREERPDIDNLYMTVAQGMTGSGGWPLTIVMTPDKIPFFAGTYFPKTGHGNRPGLLELLPVLANTWKEDPDRIADITADIQSYINSRRSGAEALIPDTILDQTFRELSDSFDSRNGGFSQAPKFPSAQNLLFLLRYAYTFGDSSAITMVVKTLDAMRKGGIFDQVGLGFHRYSTDAHWLVPHFEKMLYDQAMLLMTYAEAYQFTGESGYAKTCREIVQYLTKEMESPDGGFYAAEDADSDGSEGTFYVWTVPELKAALGQDADWALKYFGATKQGNFSEMGRPADGQNVLRIAVDSEAFAQSHGWTVDELASNVESVRTRLYQIRQKRIHPGKDTKIMTDWNGLLVAGLAQTAMALKDRDILSLAEQTYHSILTQNRSPDGRLLKRRIDGVAGLPAILDDYAFMIWGGLNLYKATGNVDYLRTSLELAKIAEQDFWDSEKGGFFLGSERSSDIPVRMKTGYDGAIPSGNSIMALNLMQLGRITGETAWTQKADSILNAFSGELVRVPRGFSGMLLSKFEDQPEAREIVVVFTEADSQSSTEMKELRALYLPTSVIVEKSVNEPVDSVIPWLKDYQSIDRKPTFYICRNYACEQPTSSFEKVLDNLKHPNLTPSD